MRAGNTAPRRGSCQRRHWSRVGGFGLFAWWLTLVVFAVICAAFLARRTRESSPAALEKPPMLGPKFVGAAECTNCHERENSLWRGSHHQLSMEPAEGSTVLGDFNHAGFRQQRSRLKFLSEWIEVHGADRRSRRHSS